MNDHALGVLEFDKVVKMLVERTSFPPGAELAARLAPTVDLQSTTEDLERVSELRSIVDEGAGLPLEGAADIRRALDRSARDGASLSCVELVEVGRTLVAIRKVRSFLEPRREACPRLSELARNLTPHDDVVSAIASAIDEVSVEVRDSASRDLARIRRSIDRVRARIDERLQAILTKEAPADTIQEPAVHMRNGRLVLPVKRAARSRLPGIVHDQSASGATLFVEPLATVELNNELAELGAAERKEVERILRELSGLVGGLADGDLDRSVEVLGELDFVAAKALLSKTLNGVNPRLNREGRLSVRNGRHPLLLTAARDDGVVPLTIELGDGTTTLVISGPNAGGKTVALKTVGLLTLMAQSGLHVPADADTELAVFRDVFADIGDEQSIEQNLSTFSSHVRVLGEILEESREDTLVLIDEMGAGTDPDEGASLAIAVLEELTARRVPTIATTHLGTVKNHVHDYDGMANGSMAFDPDTLEPTFRFVPGVPGASHALSIAESLGMPGRLLDRARELRDADAQAIDGLLADLVEREHRLEGALEEATVEHERAKLLARDYEERLKGVRDERKRMRAQALAEAREILERAQSLVEETVKELRAREAARQAIKDARRRIRRRRSEVATELAAETSEGVRDDGEPPAELLRGMRVRVASLGREGELVELPDGRGRARVRIKSATIEVDAADLRAAESDGGPRAARRPEVSLDVSAGDPFRGELDLRGMTTDEVGDAIERFVSAAILHGFSTVRIVHGKGTGALRAKTHEVLEGLPAVKSFRLGRWGEGDTGVTVVEVE